MTLAADDRGWTARTMDRLAARRYGRARRPAVFGAMPEPRAVGNLSRGRQLIAGKFLLGVDPVDAPGRAIWDIVPEESQAQAPLQGFDWLDDLAAVGDSRARTTAQAWLAEWIARYGRGRGPGWTPALTGRRLVRWIDHAALLTAKQRPEDRDAYLRCLAGQIAVLSRRWDSSAPGLARFEALAGLIRAATAVEDFEHVIEPAVEGLATAAIRHVGADGAVASRNPEEALAVLTLLNLAADALRTAGHAVPEALSAAAGRIVPTLRALRHADGALPRFHGGGQGHDGWLDQALALSGVRARPARRGQVMGYAHAAAGRTSLVADAAPPPSGPAAAGAHASALAFELTSGRRPLIVNCGSGDSFGPDWRRAGRATPSHSTLGLEGYSSARLAEADRSGREFLLSGPSRVGLEWTDLGDELRIEMSHDGWRPSHGLTHARTLELTRDGRALAGEDLLATLSPADERTFDRAMNRVHLKGLSFAVRFHLHPDVEAEIDPDGEVVRLELRSGEVWGLEAEAGVTMRLERSVYLQRGRPQPRPTSQVVLSARTMSYASRVRWSLTKAHDTPDGLRDYARGARDPIGLTSD